MKNNKMTNELKTWEDLLNEGVINLKQYNRGKTEAIKWVKEDIKTDGRISSATLLWMKRLSITEEDLQ